ncbi:MAG: riboflavin synthase subunit alpha [Epulopiscium sp. Nele67-Bin005]|nr:MAG: riboflavin synthase subunit alpha [Epulopiscium sp. Nele67-Bin005]
MFTGIIEEVGTVKSVRKGAKSATLTISASKIFDDVKVGDSIATNGVCLTVTNFTNNQFCADIMNETLSKTSLGQLVSGSGVNLERAMPANGRFGGHMVTGHIDGVGSVLSIIKDDIAIWYKIKAPQHIMKYIIEKGSITIDGISLTVAKVERDNFSVSIIPHTASNTTLSKKSIGAVVNLENDIVGKYVEKLLNKESNITTEFLAKHGF